MLSPVDTKPSLALLPPRLRVTGTTFTRIATGESGAAVFRVESHLGVVVLKVTSLDDPPEVWERSITLQREGAERRVAPRVLHVDAVRRAVVSENIIDRSFASYYHTPDTHEAAMALLGDAIRHVHEIPPPPGMPVADAPAVLGQLAQDTTSAGSLPMWVQAHIESLLAASVPESDRDAVVSHNDLNPTNMIFDGERLALLDWQTASGNDPYYDLATAAVFLRMDDVRASALLSRYAGTVVASLPARFCWSRIMVGTLAGSALLRVARTYRFADQPQDSDARAPLLAEVYAALRDGSLAMNGEGQWRLGIALIRSVMS